MEKDHEAVSNWYFEKYQTEFVICHLLNSRMPLFLKIKGYFFEMADGNQYSTHDIVLWQYSSSKEKKEIIKVEYENGAKQPMWDTKLPRVKWQGLNMLIRKQYGKTFSLFIKSSVSYKSFFAVDCRDDFVQSNFGDRTIPHNFGFETDKDVFTVYWHLLDEHLFVDDKINRILENKNICIVEDDNWDVFYNFLWRRFLK